MADETTPNYGLVKPSVGLDRDIWGDLTNANWDTVDAQLKAATDAAGSSSSSLAALIANIRAYVEPIGSIKPWPSPVAPIGWFPCDGTAISRTDYSALFAVIGGYWGYGDGSTTFNLPNFLGRVLAHRDNTTIGVTGQYGEFYHALSWNEMPVHNHAASADVQGDHTHAVQDRGSSGGGGTTGAFPIYSGGYGFNGANTSVAGNHGHNISIGTAGSGYAHNNIQPTTGVLWIIKAANLF